MTFEQRRNIGNRRVGLCHNDVPHHDVRDLAAVFPDKFAGKRLLPHQ
jgi:hypothetical protein